MAWCFLFDFDFMQFQFEAKHFAEHAGESR